MSNLAITCIRDEGPWLLDWIAHHQAAGFDHFLIASHDCTDGTDDMLDALAEAGVVTHVPFEIKGKKSVQWQALKLLSDHPVYLAAERALFFDVDEYLVLDGDATLATLLSEDADAVTLRWHLFGNSGLFDWEDRPVTARFTMAAPDDMPFPLAQLFKTLHRPSAFKGLGVHRPKGQQGRWQGAGGVAFSDKFAKTPKLIHLFGIPSVGERAWLNHYSVRSIEEFVLKSKRGLPNHMEKNVDAGYWAVRNFNVTEDRRIAPMLKATRRIRLAQQDFDELHMRSVAHHRARLAELVRTRPVVDLMLQLELLPGSTPPSPAQINAHLSRLIAAQSGA